jgi:ribosomal protein S18 acetylase RimI-like enzyme
MAVCFRGFSTFAARPLINIHDIYVDPPCRGWGVAHLLLEAVEAKARAMECCKLTLEVQERNTKALRLYEHFGFTEGIYDPEAGRVLFRWKAL